MSQLPPMTSGGVWLRISDHREPVYVTHEAHIKRLLAEGAQPTSDPRDPEKLRAVAETPTEDALREENAQMQRRIANQATQLEVLQAQIQALIAQTQQSTQDDAEPAPKAKRTKQE